MRCGIVVFLLAAVVACGDSPTSPTAVRPQSLAINTPVDWLFTGETIVVRAAATFADGVVRTVTPQWSVDDARLATIDSNGRLVGRGSGIATVVATVEGISASYPLRVIADHRGTWTGALRQTACRYWDFRTCGRSYPANSTFVLQLQLQQQREAVQGTFDVAITYPAGGLMQGTSHQVGTAGGVLAIDGTLTMEGDITNGGVAVGTMFRWRSHVEEGALRGGFSLLYPIYNPDLYPLTLEYDIVELRRTP
jgi:hypothetical protein